VRDGCHIVHHPCRRKPASVLTLTPKSSNHQWHGNLTVVMRQDEIIPAHYMTL
jgi:hypothetical protein